MGEPNNRFPHIRNITIAREYGSGGGPVANILAQRLNWKVINDPLIMRMSQALHASPEDIRVHDETVDPWFYRMTKALWRGGYEGALSRPDAEPLDADAIETLWNRVIVEAAAQGNCVVVGRGSQCLLSKRPDTFHVFLYGPLTDRVARLKTELPEDTDLRAAAIERDRKRAEYMRYYFDRDWRDPHLYNLMVCTSIGLERTADLIMLAAGLPQA